MSVELDWVPLEGEILDVGLGRPDSDFVCITERQKKQHMAWEVAGLAVVVPFSVYLATRKELPPWARVVSAGIAGATLVIDGLLLNRMRKL